MESEQKHERERALRDAKAESDYVLAEAPSYLECAAALLEKFLEDRKPQARSQVPDSPTLPQTTTLENGGGPESSVSSIQLIRCRLESVLNCLVKAEEPFKSATAHESREAGNPERFFDPFDFGGMWH